MTDAGIDADSLHFESVTHRYGRTRVLESFTWTVPEGRTALLGPNGAGKSTLLSIAASGLRPRSGRVVLGRSAWPSRARARTYRASVGWMPQQNEFVPHLSVAENVRLAAWLKGVDTSAQPQSVKDALDKARLSDRAGDAARRLSGGQQRRLCFAQAVVHKPRVLLLDEPTVGLDPSQREGFRRVLADTSGTDVLVATHQVDDIDDVFDTVIVLLGGEIRFEGSTAEFLALAPPGERRGERAYLTLEPDVGS